MNSVRQKAIQVIIGFPTKLLARLLVPKRIQIFRYRKRIEKPIFFYSEKGKSEHYNRPEKVTPDEESRTPDITE